MAAPLRILLLEDHDALREVTVGYLRNHGYAADGIESVEALTERSGSEHIDLYILDLNLPGEDGISLARRLRKFHPEVGIIMLTARNAASDKIKGYEAGADIYLMKPTSPDELIAAIQAISRRLRPPASDASQLHLHMQSEILRGPAGRVELSSREAQLLAAFIRAPGKQLETWQIIELQGKEMTENSKGTVEVQIVRLRKKLLLATDAERPIKVLRGLGYQLCIDILLA